MYTNLSTGGQDLVWGMALREAELMEEGRPWQKKWAL